MPAGLLPSGQAAVVRVKLRNVRGFEDLDLDLSLEGRGRQTTVVIGRNGTNKSTLLRAIALGLASPSDADALLALPLGSLINHRAKSARIELHIHRRSSEPTIIAKTLMAESANRDSVGEVTGPSGSELGLELYGYGAARGPAGADTARRFEPGVFENAGSLFDYSRTLADPELTVRRLRDLLGSDRYEQIFDSLRVALGLSKRDEFILMRGGGLALRGPTFGRTTPVYGLADGYRLTFNWVMDVYARALRRLDKSGAVRGLMLVDELEQHLHPALQAGMVKQLSAMFPRVQFVVTTHSPLVALGAEPLELVPLRRSGQSVYVEPTIPDYRGWSAEDMLSDERLFDSPVLAPQDQELVDRYEAIVAIDPERRTPEQRRELVVLVGQLAQQPLPPAVDEQLQRALDALHLNGNH